MTPTATIPLRIGTDRAAETLAGVFHRASFDESTIADALQLPSLEAVDHPVFKTLVDRLSGRGLLEMLARVFVFGEAIERTAIRSHLSEAELDALVDVDLLRPWSAEGAPADRLFSPVRLVPVQPAGAAAGDVIIAGDRADHPDGSPFVPFADIVFPGHNPLTREFLKLLPHAPRGSVLDLCAGSAVASLAMAARGCHSVAADIAERSAHFARFNVWLNRTGRVEIVCGDLYEPVGSRRFDCVMAHPPYVPALANKLTYRDGGESGDQIVRRVIQGVPDHLNTGGTFHLLCLAMDTAEGPFEERVRRWLGPAEREFDIVFALDSTTPPELIATRLIDRSGGTIADLMRWRELFGRLKVKEFVYGALVGRRFGGATGAAATRRVLLTNDSTIGGFEWLFRWFDWLREPGGASRVLDLKPALPPDLKLDVQHRIEAGTFTPTTYFLENGGRPFRARLSTDAWVAALLSELNGERTVREVFQHAAARGRVPGDVTEPDLERLISFLIERGCVGVPESLLPTTTNAMLT